MKVFDNTPDAKRKEENITTMMENMNTNNMLSHLQESNRGLVNVFTSVVATPEQHHDIMNFREVGTEYFKHYINYYILKSSTRAPVRQHRLLTMCPKKQGKQVVSLKLSETKQVGKCLREKLSWCIQTGQTYDPYQEQYSLYPWAIADEDGCPRKGTKAVWKDKIRK